jgi:succinoglycan biosynthesis transport protein ExoP
LTDRAPLFQVTMLDAKSQAYLLPSEPAPRVEHEPSAAETIARGLGIVRRQIFVVLAFAVLGVALGAIYVLKSPPKYTATVTLLADTRKIELVQQPTVYDEAPIQSVGAMETQVELLRSDELALRVIKKLNLSEDPRFVGSQQKGLRSLLGSIAPGYFAESPALSEDERQSLALAQFDKNLTVARIGVSYAIEIDFESRYPGLAAEIANAVADVYIELQRSTEYDAARRASDWLEQRIPGVRAKSEDAQKAVVDYKHEHNIVETVGGQLIDDQRLTDMNTKLNAAHDETANAKARFDQFSAARGLEVPRAAAVSGSSANSSASVDDSLDKLRSEYFDVVSKEAEASVRLGPNNPGIISLRNQKAQLRVEITEEIQRLKEANESDYAAAQLRESDVKKEYDAVLAQYQQASQAQVKLRELTASAQAYQDLYNTFLGRYNASLQQIASPIAEASVITPASPLIPRDYKKTYKTAALFPALGLALGLGVAVLREMIAGRVFLTSKSVQSHLRIPCIGLLPKVQNRKRKGWLAKKVLSDNGPRTLVRGDRGIGWTAIDHPLSRFSEGVRSIKLAIDLENRSRSSKVIGVTSATPNEGKSTVALALGQLIARNGASSVVVVDCDLRNPSLTRSVAPSAASGIAELAFGGTSLEDVIWRDPSTQMAFVPAIPHAGPPDPPSILSSAELKQVFDALRKQYEFVVVDLSPLGGVIDVCATTELIDAYVLVIEWGRTTADAVQHTLRAAPNVSESILGAVLNKADIKSLASYDPYLTSYYFEN